MKMNNTLKQFVKKVGLLAATATAIVYMIWAYNLYDPIETFFIAFGWTGIQLLLNGESIGLALYLFFIQICCWGVFYFLFKVAFIDTIFPIIRIVTPEKDAFKVCRKVNNYTPPHADPRYVYMHVRFHKLPILRWHVLKIPKPEYTGTFNKKVVQNGCKGLVWRRMPASLDILTNTIDVGWNAKEEAYEIGYKHDAVKDDPAEPYEIVAFRSIQETGENIIESCKGDYGLIKDQFHMGIVVREKQLLQIGEQEPDTVVRRDVIRRLKER